MYDKAYTAPITVWFQKCTSPITQIKWCMLYFDDESNRNEVSSSSMDGVNFTTRISEFFVID